MPTDRLFISYSHEDGKWLESFRKHLKPYARLGLIICDDTRIQAGSLWEKEIQKELSQCGAALLLVSPDFLASDFIHDKELPPLLEARRKRELLIHWVHLSASAYEVTPIAAI